MALRNRYLEQRAERRIELIETTLCVVIGALVISAGLFGLVVAVSVLQ